MRVMYNTEDGFAMRTDNDEHINSVDVLVAFFWPLWETMSLLNPPLINIGEGHIGHATINKALIKTIVMATAVIYVAFLSPRFCRNTRNASDAQRRGQFRNEDRSPRAHPLR